ncbi:MAG: beta-ketoacyl-[acyl-carrier-protein] synthase family protein, partial [Actinomycetia bacterium]|nr:beta-ketoacyl-[acyl-carrier-protein] synthase family protein [Actinomycetes bacterium]
GNDSVSGANIEMWEELRESRETRTLGSGFIFQIMNSTINMNLSTIFGTKGACWTLSGACASGSHSIGQAADLIRNGRQTIMLAGGGQEVNLESMAAFDALTAFSKNISNPTGASRPFDKDRDGLVPSGGGACVILEDYEHAKARGAKMYAEILSYAFSSDGADLTVATGEGAEFALKMVLKNAGMNASDIDYVSAHATATPVGDVAEARALRNIFGDKTPISSTKSMTGHECWMAGASELIYSVLMHKDGFIAPNINFEEPDEDTKGINVVKKTLQEKPVNIISNSFGFGGTNSVLLIKGLM